MTYKFCVDPCKACLELLHQGFEAGSNGSEKLGTDGSFGWIIRMSQGERTSMGMGPSRGQVMDTYCAECSSMHLLFILRFLIRISEQTNLVEEIWHGTIGTDSQSMAARHYLRTGEQRTGSVSPSNTPKEAGITRPLNTGVGSTC